MQKEGNYIAAAYSNIGGLFGQPFYRIQSLSIDPEWDQKPDGAKCFRNSQVFTINTKRVIGVKEAIIKAGDEKIPAAEMTMDDNSTEIVPIGSVVDAANPKQLQALKNRMLTGEETLSSEIFYDKTKAIQNANAWMMTQVNLLQAQSAEIALHIEALKRCIEVNNASARTV